jgi:protein-disulfide isomerase
MNGSKILFLSSLVLFGACAGMYLTRDISQETPKFTIKDKSEIEQIVHDYLINKPEVLVKASQELQKKAQQKQIEITMQGIAENKTQMLDPSSPELGNPKGDVILVKFIDYQCGHCKDMEKVVEELISENPQLKVVVKELPVIGGDSIIAAKAALASSEQGKFSDLHHKLLQEKQKLTEQKIMEIAENAGIDVQKLKEDMEAEAIQDEIEKSYDLARKLSIQGTPFFVIMGNPDKGNDKVAIMPGAAPKPQLQALINKVQEK